MASVPPEDGSILPTGWTWSDVGHGALDIVGLVPVFGEAADLTNAAWYAAEGNYLDAGLSAISTVPIVGDIIGKGGKIAKKAGGKLAGPALDALKKIDFKKTLEPLRKHPKIGPHVDKMAKALEKWRKELVGEAPSSTPGGLQLCPKRIRALAGDLVRMGPTAARKKLTELSPAERKAVLKELVSDPALLDVSTKPNTAVFYSGRVATDSGYLQARTFAEAKWSDGKTTLEATVGGKFLDDLKLYGDKSQPDKFTPLLDSDDADEIWTGLSERYARAAKGDVLVYQGEMRPNAVLPHELKILEAKKASGEVTNIRVIELGDMIERLTR